MKIRFRVAIYNPTESCDTDNAIGSPMVRFDHLLQRGSETVIFTPFQFMTGRWGNRTFQSNTSLHRCMDDQLPVATFVAVNINIPSKPWEMKEKDVNYD